MQERSRETDNVDGPSQSGSQTAFDVSCATKDTSFFMLYGLYVLFSLLLAFETRHLKITGHICPKDMQKLKSSQALPKGEPL